MLTPRRIGLDHALVPDTKAWGPGFADRGLGSEHLSDAVALVEEWVPTQGYGSRTRGFSCPEGVIFRLPHGFDAIGSPERNRFQSFDIEHPTTPWDQHWERWKIPAHLSDLFRSQGFVPDQHGRPCNPWGPEVASHPGIGLNTGIGDGRFWGETVRLMVVPVDKSNGYFALTKPKSQDEQPAVITQDCLPNDFGPDWHEWELGVRPVHEKGLWVAARRMLELGMRLKSGKHHLNDVVLAHRRPWPQDTWNWWALTIVVTVEIDRGPHNENARATWVPTADFPAMQGLRLMDREAIKAALR